MIGRVHYISPELLPALTAGDVEVISIVFSLYYWTGVDVSLCDWRGNATPHFIMKCTQTQLPGEVRALFVSPPAPAVSITFSPHSRGRREEGGANSEL